jgi:3-hydroxyacyl-CoA dehydrogenase
MNTDPVPSLNPWFPPAESGAPAPKPLRAIGIAGVGQTAVGIAHWCAAKGHGVIMYDTQAAALTQAVGLIRGLFREMEARNEITHPDAHKAMGGIGITTGLEDMEFCDILIDTSVEDAASKRARFEQFGRVLPPEALLAAAASTAGLEELTAVTRAPERLIGLQFFDPVATSPHVHVVIGSRTARDTAERVLAFAKVLGKRVLLQGTPRPTT